MRRPILALCAALLCAAPAQAQNAQLAQAQAVVAQVQTVLNDLISAGEQFVQTDLNLALADAKAQGNTSAAACWTDLLALNFAPIPTGAGLAYFKQRLLDAEAVYVKVNQDCAHPAPLFVKAYNAFINQANQLQL